MSEQNEKRRDYGTWEEAFRGLAPVVRQQSVRIATYTQALFIQACAAGFGAQTPAGAQRMQATYADLAYKCGMYHQLGKALVPEEYQTPSTAFTAEEEQLYRKYTTDGRRLVARLQEAGAPSRRRGSDNGEEIPTENIPFLMIRESCQQHMERYDGTGYPEGRRGSVTRYGNGVEIYGGCDDYIVKNCYIYQIYDAAITHQITTNGKKFELKNIKYIGNLVENCVYSIEYFLDENMGVDGSIVENCEMAENILRFSGFGWGQQRHNTYTPAHIKGWSYTNTAREFSIHNNIFDRAAYRMIHTVALEESSCPEMYENTYIQNLAAPLGQYGANQEKEPPNIVFDENAEKSVADKRTGLSALPL